LLVKEAMGVHGISQKEAIRMVAGQRNVSRRGLYQLLLSNKRTSTGGEL